MPNIKSAKKRVKVSEKKNLRNRMIKSAVRTSVKKLEAAIAADPQTANAQLVVTTSAIDKAASKGVMPRMLPIVRRLVWPSSSPRRLCNFQIT